ncbi:MAG: ribose 5-phosphate isomerase B [Campylobacteraceae bacterium]|nr:ribose 5-phosphate isomerase B [Campylobacteraceae bacterium]
MKIYIASDHAGFGIKAEVTGILREKECEVVDLGTKSDARVDYPDFAHILCEAVLKDSGSFGVLICGSGIGMSMCANRHEGIRAALCHDAYTAKMARAHNNANVLCFGERVVGLGVIKSMIEAWLSEPFEGGRHADRVKKIEI